MYIISSDTLEQQAALHSVFEESYGESLPFVSDPELEMIELFGMRNGNMANRGYGLMDAEGKVIFSTANDLWGQQLTETVSEIKEEYENIR